MAKASPAKNVFEGEFSPLAVGRTDLERYPRSMRSMLNLVSTKQGPAIRRSGTQFNRPVFDETKQSHLLPFVFNENEVLIMEFADHKIRWHYQYDGILSNFETTPTAIDSIGPTVIHIVGHPYAIGDTLVFRDLPAAFNLNGLLVKVVAITADTVTLAANPSTPSVGAIPGGPPTPYIARVYELDTVYAEADVRNIRARQWLDTVYLFCDGYRPQVLQRYALFDWRIRDMKFKDGPYLPVNETTTRLIPDKRGTWVPDMTAASAPSGAASADTEAATHEAWRAFDGNPDTYWESTTAQKGILQYAFVAQTNAIPLMTAPTTGGVTMSASSEGGLGSAAWKARDGNNDTDWRTFDGGAGFVPQWIQIDFGVNKTILEYTLRASRNKKEFSVRDWTLSGAAAPGGPYTVVDTRVNVVWKSGEKKLFTVQAPAAFRYYRINCTQVNRKDITVTIPAEGKPGKPGYKPKKTITTRTDPRVAIANMEMFETTGVSHTVTGYTIHIARNNGDDVDADQQPLESARKFAPRTWTFEGYDGTAWTILDSQQDYKEGYKNDRRSEYFPIQNATPYQAYRLNVKEVVGSGSTKVVRVGQLTLFSDDAPFIGFTATSQEGINNDLGFLPTDVGRVMRVLGTDNHWRWFEITEWISETQITALLKEGDPFLYRKSTMQWRLGMFSDTTGWPIDATFYEDRLWVGGARDNPDTVCSSRTGDYERYRPSSPKGLVLDDHGIVVRMLSRYLSRIKWMSADVQGVLIGTGVGEHTITTPNDEALTARNIKARPLTRNGSYAIDAVEVNSKVFHSQLNRRSLNVLSYDGRANGYTDPSISTLASHLAFPFVEQIVYANEPHGTLWARRADGSVVAMTYDDDSDMIGGHRHDFGGLVQSLAVLPSPSDGQDILWMVIDRQVNGVTRRYIEWLVPYWDFGDTLDNDAQYVDSSLRYLGLVPASVFYGLHHMTGEKIDVLADGIQYRDLDVVNGTVTLPNAALSVVGGKRFRSEGEIQSMEAGAADGTAQGKQKRPNLTVLQLFESYGGYVGRYNDDTGEVEYTPIEYAEQFDELTPVELQTIFTETIVLPMGYGKRGTINFMTDDLYPLNLIALLPQINTQDR